MPESKKIALALGSGGARGLAHIGVIEILEENGFQISSLSGTSMGAVIGGIYAAGHLQDYKEWIVNMDRKAIFNLIDFTITNQGFIKGERVFNEIRKFVPSKNIEELPIPFCAVATDIKSKSEVRFDKGDLFTAIRASVAIPSVLTPLSRDGRILVDGGVINPVPVTAISRSENDRLIAVDLNADVPYKRPEGFEADQEKEKKEIYSRIGRLFELSFDRWFFNLKLAGNGDQPNYFTIIQNVFEMMQNELGSIQLEKTPPDVLIEVSRNCAETFEFFRASELIEYGRRLGKEAINELEMKKTISTDNS